MHEILLKTGSSKYLHVPNKQQRGQVAKDHHQRRQLTRGGRVKIQQLTSNHWQLRCVTV